MAALLASAYRGNRCLACGVHFWPKDNSGGSHYNCLGCQLNPNIAEACNAKYAQYKVERSRIAATRWSSLVRAKVTRTDKARNAWDRMVRGISTQKRKGSVAREATQLHANRGKTEKRQAMMTRWKMLTRGIVSKAELSQAKVERRFTELKLIKLRRDYHELRQNLHKSRESKKPEVAKESAKQPPKMPEVAKESAKQPPRMPEVAKESAKQPPKMPEVAKESAKQPPKMPEVAKESAKQPPKMPEVAKESAKQPPKKPAVAKEDPKKPEVAKEDPKKPEVAKEDPKKPEVAKDDPKKPEVAKDDPKESLVESGIHDDSVPPVSIRLLNLGPTRPMLNNAPVQAKACDTIIEKTMNILDKSMRAMIDADATKSQGIDSILCYQTGIIAGSEDVDMSKLAIRRGADDRRALLHLCQFREPYLRAIIRGRMSILVPIFRMMDQKAPEDTRSLLRTLLAMRLADPHLVKLAKTAAGCSREKHNRIRRNLFRIQFGIVVVHAEARALLQMLEQQN